MVDHEMLRTHLGYAHAVAHDMSMPDDDGKADAVASHIYSCHTALAEKSPFPGNSSDSAFVRDDHKHMERGSVMGYKSEFRDEVLALTGAGDEAKALGVLAALKEKADQVEALSARIEELETAQKKAALDKLLADLTPAQREKVVALSEKFGIEAAQEFVAEFGKRKRPELAQPPKEEAAPVALGGLTDEQLKIIRLSGTTPEKWLEHKRDHQARKEAFRAGADAKEQ